MKIAQRIIVLIVSTLIPHSIICGQVYENHVGISDVETETPWFTLGSEGNVGLFNRSGLKTASVFGGWSFPDFRDNVGNNYYPSQRLAEGSTVGFAMGKAIGPRLRSEFEFTWRNNDVENFYGGWGYPISLPFIYEAIPEGEVNTYSGMFNLVFDFDRAEGRLLTPYAGVGIGTAYIDNDVSWNGVGATISNELAFAYQALGGVSLKLRNNSDFFVEYRYFSTDSVAYTQPGYNGMYRTTEAQDFYHSFQSHQFLMGLRFRY
jgi:opacity protein-like surface antigen